MTLTIPNVSPEVYARIEELAAETQRPISEAAADALAFGTDRLLLQTGKALRRLPIGEIALVGDAVPSDEMTFEFPELRGGKLVSLAAVVRAERMPTRLDCDLAEMPS